MPPIGDCAAFAYRNATVDVGEVLRAAQFRNELQAAASHFEWQAACEREASRLGLEADDGAIGALVDRFRFEKDLISAEETEAWLDSRGISPDEFHDYFGGCHWWGLLREKVAPVPVNSMLFDSERLEALAPGLVLSDSFRPLAVELSRRLIAGNTPKEAASDAAIAAERARFFERSGLEPGVLEGWLAALGRGQDWFGGMIAMEVSFRALRDSVLTPQRLSGALGSLRLPLTRLEVERVEFDSIDAAREGHLCVRDDGLSLEEVARETRFPFKRLDVLSEDLSEEDRQGLLFARVGELLGPAQSGGVFHVSRVLQKREPTVDDARIRDRLERRIVDTYFSEAGSKDVRWFIT